MHRRAFLLLPTFALLAGCDTPPMRQSYATLTFQDRPQIGLDVAQIQIVQAYRAPGVAPHVDHLFPQKPVDVAAAWGRDVLRAVGQRGEATYIIVDASATDTQLPRSTGLTQMFKTEQSDRYDLHIAVKLEVENPTSTGGVFAEANRSQTVAENMTLNQREAVWFQMTESAMRELDGKLEAAIHDKLRVFVR
ncbi:MAG TPA: hypothetical protein VGF43_05380 [Dongiaceae bacterium]|jgi:hypothetical protein